MPKSHTVARHRDDEEFAVPTDDDRRRGAKTKYKPTLLAPPRKAFFGGRLPTTSWQKKSIRARRTVVPHHSGRGPGPIMWGVLSPMAGWRQCDGGTCQSSFVIVVIMIAGWMTFSHSSLAAWCFLPAVMLFVSVFYSYRDPRYVEELHRIKGP